MTRLAEWLLILSVAAPLLGGIAACIAVSGRQSWPRLAKYSANAGILGGFVSSLGLLAVLHVHRADLPAIAVKLGAWIWVAGSRRLPSTWGLHADLTAAIWLSTFSGLAWLTTIQRRGQTNESMPILSIAAALVVAASASFVLASDLIQTLASWVLISVTSFVAVLWTARSAESISGARRAIGAGLLGDVLLVLSVLLIGSVSGLSLLDLSPTRSTDPASVAFLGLVGCLLVLCMLVRSGMFPFFGWHYDMALGPSQFGLIYGIGYLPAAFWLLVKLYPILISSDSALPLATGLGTLAAVVASFVACGQALWQRRLAYMVSAQYGLLLAGIGTGNIDSRSACVWHLVGLSISVVVVAMTNRIGGVIGRGDRIAACCGALALAGVLPFSTAWTQHAILEMALNPVTPATTEHSPDSKATSDTSEVAPSRVLVAVAPQWYFIGGLWLSQTLSAAAAVGLCRSRSSDITNVPRESIATDLAAAIGVSWVLAAGPIGWLLGFVSIPTSSGAVLHLAAGQAALISGGLLGWRLQRVSQTKDVAEARSASACEPLIRLSQERLYIDQVWQRLTRGPTRLARWIATRWIVPENIDRSLTSSLVRSAAWIGLHVESLRTERADFAIAAALLGTVVLMLTLVLVT